MSRTWLDKRTLFPEFDAGTFIREELLEGREREWVDFCFEAYESDGFKETFGTSYTGERKYVGMKFEVLGRVGEYPNDPKGADLECLPMWNIRLEDGTEMAAYPEEICLSETPEYREKNRKAFEIIK